MTHYALVHDGDCACPSTYYEIRPGGYAWLSCRRCSAQAVRRLPQNHDPKENQ